MEGMVSYHVAYLFLAELLIELKSNKADFLHTFSHRNKLVSVRIITHFCPNRVSIFVVHNPITFEWMQTLSILAVLAMNSDFLTLSLLFAEGSLETAWEFRPIKKQNGCSALRMK